MHYGKGFQPPPAVRSCCKSCSISNGKLLPYLSSSCLFLSAFLFHQPQKFPGDLILKKVCRGGPRKFSKRGLDRSQMEQPIKKNKFSHFARSRFGFVHKRSGNEIKVKPRKITRFMINNIVMHST